MSLWQRSLIRLARSERLKRVMERVVGATPLARRFVGGESPAAAVAAARRLRDDLGIAASLFYLGEYMTDPVLVEKNVETTLVAIQLLGAERLDGHVSVDPTTESTRGPGGLQQRDEFSGAAQLSTTCPARNRRRTRVLPGR